MHDICVIESGRRPSAGLLRNEPIAAACSLSGIGTNRQAVDVIRSGPDYPGREDYLVAVARICACSDLFRLNQAAITRANPESTYADGTHRPCSEVPSTCLPSALSCVSAFKQFLSMHWPAKLSRRFTGGCEYGRRLIRRRRPDNPKQPQSGRRLRAPVRSRKHGHRIVPCRNGKVGVVVTGLHLGV